MTIPVPDANTLSYLSDLVDASNRFFNPRKDPMMVFLRTKIKHVIYIQKENRTYDQVLGDLDPPGAGRDLNRVQFPPADLTQPSQTCGTVRATRQFLRPRRCERRQLELGHTRPANDAAVKNVLVGYCDANSTSPSTGMAIRVTSALPC